MNENERENMMKAISKELKKMDYNKLMLVLTFAVGLCK